MLPPHPSESPLNGAELVFRLVQQEEMSECRGSLDYITTWRAQVVGR